MLRSYRPTPTRYACPYCTVREYMFCQTRVINTKLHRIVNPHKDLEKETRCRIIAAARTTRANAVKPKSCDMAPTQMTTSGETAA